MRSRATLRTLVAALLVVLMLTAYDADASSDMETSAMVLDLAVGAVIALFAWSTRSPSRGLAFAAVAATWLAGSAWVDLVGLHRGAFLMLVVIYAGTRAWSRPVLLALGGVAVLLALPDVGPGLAAALLVAAAVAIVMAGEPVLGAGSGALLLLAATEVGVAVGLRVGSSPSGLLNSVYALALLLSATWVWAAALERRRMAAQLAPATGDLAGRDVFPVLTELVGSALHDPGVRVEPATVARLATTPGRSVAVRGRPWAWVRSSAAWLSDDTVWLPLHDAVARVGEWEHLLADDQALAVSLAASRARLVDAADRERAEVGARLRQDVLSPMGRAADLLAPAFPLIGRELSEAIADVESLIVGVPPVPLGAGALVAAVTELAQRCPLRVDVMVLGHVATTTPIETALYAVCAEALTNTLKHAEATRVDVMMESDADEIRLSISDDGIGFVAPATAGIAGLVDRVSAVGGQLSIASPQRQGTTVTVAVPTSSPAHDSSPP